MSTWLIGLSHIHRMLLALRHGWTDRHGWLARGSVFALSMAVMSSSCAAAHGPRVSASGYLKMRLYLDQLNRQVAAEKAAIVGEAKLLVNQSNKTIEQCEKGLSKTRGELAVAADRVASCDKSLNETVSAIRAVQNERADREKRILADQDDNSLYRRAVNELQAAEEESAKNAGRVLNHPVIDGNPQKLSSLLKKGELKVLEEDQAWVNAARQYNQSKEQVAEELRRLLLADKTITKLDETFRRLIEDQKQQRAELATARSNHRKLKNEAARYLSMLECANYDLQSAQLVIAKITGK